MFMILLVIALLIAGYLVGLLLKPKFGITLTITSLLGIFAYIFFFAEGENSPSFTTTVALVMAFFAPFIVLAYGSGALIGALTRWLTKKNGKIYLIFITLFVLFGSFFYIAYYAAYIKEKEANMKREELLALNYVKNHPEVIAIAGEKLEAFPPSCIVKGNLPVRCEISVRGTKNIYAIVDISRLSGNPIFTLTCITYLSQGQRNTFKNTCDK